MTNPPRNRPSRPERAAPARQKPSRPRLSEKAAAAKKQREARLADRLRDNLHRRKAQIRVRESGGVAAEDEPSGD
ncbi:MAG: hypothetical protein RLP16_04030 [Alphaproteobacteria bacterium]